MNVVVRRVVLLVAVVAALVVVPAAFAEDGTELMPGVSYTRSVRTIAGKAVVLHVLVAPKPGGLYSLEPVLSNGTVQGRETVTAMQQSLAARATVAGVNGDLFSYDDDAPSGMLLRDGVLISRPSSGRSSLAIAADGLLRLGRVGFFGRWSIAGSERRPLAQLNRPLTGNGAALYTGLWGETAPSTGRGVDVVIGPLPDPAPNTDLVAPVVQVGDAGATRIPDGGAVLRVAGPLGPDVRAAAVPGAQVTIRLGLRPWWEAVEDAIGGGPALVDEGRVVVPTTEHFTATQLLARTARTAVGQRADGKVLLVVADGGTSASAGVTVAQLAAEMGRLGAVTAIALDAGGSATLAFEGRLLNTPSGGSERRVANALMVLYYGVYLPPPSEPVLSPNGDGVGEREQLGVKLVRRSTVDARLVGPGGHVFYREEGEKEPGSYPYVIDPEILSKEGAWRWVVRAVDGDGNASKAERAFTVNKTLGFLELSTKKMKVAPRRGGKLAIAFELTRLARVAVTVRTAGGSEVARLLSRWQEAGAVSIGWNGRSEDGRVVVPGRYTVRVEARNKLGLVSLEAAVTVRRR